MIKINICIDAGHCKLTPGKRSFDKSFFEWEFNLDVANRIKKYLDRHGVNSYVQYIENPNPTTELNTRISAINKNKPTLVISIHANAYGTDWNNANGWEIFCSTPSNSAAKGTVLAKAIQKYSKVLGLKDRGVKDAHGVAGIVVNTTPPAVLVEHGFYTNQPELAKLKTDKFREQCAIADTKGILEYLGIPWKEEDEEEMTEAEVRRIVKEMLRDEDNIPSGWAKEVWEKAKKEGLTDGTNPQGYITREEAAAMIQRAK